MPLFLKVTIDMNYPIAEQFDQRVCSITDQLTDYRTTLEINRQGPLSTVYAPFDFINVSAKICIVGITPGHQQAVNALRAYRDQRRAGKSIEVSLQQAKRCASFSGPMRANLVKVLDHVRLNENLKIESCGELFDDSCTRAHFTSVLRYPVFRDNANYSGSPNPVTTSFLSTMYLTYLTQEVAAIQNSFWVPLGTAATHVFADLIKRGLVRREKVLSGIPHPSGANAERISIFLGTKDPANASRKTDAGKILEARCKISEQIREGHLRGN